MSTDDPLAAALAAAGLGGARPGQPAAGPPPPGPAIVLPDSAAEEPAPSAARWPDGAATGVGSMPGTDVTEAAAVVVGELPLLPHLPELPARGVGADMLGRTAALLVDIFTEVWPSGYRVTARSGLDHRRGLDLLRFDVDAFDEACDPVRPAWVKVQAAGPWTLAAGIELHTGHRVLTDRGALREFTASLAEGLRVHLTEVAARTGAAVLVQLDEPTLPAVLDGRLSTPSGYGTVAAAPEPDVQELLRELIGGLGAPVVVHCCAARPPIRLLAEVGAAALGIDATLPQVAGDTAEPALLDTLGEVWDAGTPLMLGVVPSRAPARRLTYREPARLAFDLADRLGFDRARLPALAVPTPTCGLAGADPAWARRALALCGEVAANLRDPTEEG